MTPQKHLVLKNSRFLQEKCKVRLSVVGVFSAILSNLHVICMEINKNDRNDFLEQASGN